MPEDNLEPTSVENSSPETARNESTMEAPTETSVESTYGGWKSGIGTDLRNSPLLQKFEDTPDGLNKAMESHANLEKLLGHEKVPIPKNADDTEGWNRFSKAMGIPDKAEDYGLPNFEAPENLKDLTFNKGQFAEIAHAHKLTPDQTKGLWKMYTELSTEAYAKAVEGNQTALNDTINQLRSEWGDTYDVNVELAQTVINKFSADQDSNDWLTSTLTRDPKGIKFLAKLGDQFAEAKLGEFQMKKFSLGPEEAIEAALKMSRDLDGPYMNQSDKFTPKEHQVAVDQYNNYIRISQKR